MMFRFRLISALMLISLPYFVIAQEAEVATLLSDDDQRFESIHWLPDGRIISVDFPNGNVYEVFTDGNIDTLVNTNLNILGGGYDSESNFYFCDYTNGDVLRLNDDGTFETVSSGYDGPIAVLQDSDDPDLFYVSEYNDSKLSTFQLSTGERSEWLEGDGIFFPDGVIYDWNGDILIANFENHRIHRVDENGELALFADLGVSGDMGYITITGDYLYVTSLASDKVFRVDMDGNSEIIAGSTLNGNTDGPGLSARFQGPNGICANAAGDTLLVADFDRVRIITNFEPIPTGVEEIHRENDLVLFPNPSSDVLGISLKNHDGTCLSWKIRDMQGRWIKKGKVSTFVEGGFEVAVQDLEPGTYSIRIVTEDGEKIAKNFVKYDN